MSAINVNNNSALNGYKLYDHYVLDPIYENSIFEVMDRRPTITLIKKRIDVDGNENPENNNDGKYFNWDYIEFWLNDKLIKIADDIDNDTIYDISFFDTAGNLSFKGKDTNLDAQADSEIELYNNCDGVIDTCAQGNTGDCWLVTGINSLSYTEKGTDIIKNAICPQDDGSILVHTAIGDYTITYDEFKEAKISEKYCFGDDDGLILELVTEKVLNDFIEGKTYIPVDIKGTSGFILEYQTKNGAKSIEDNCVDIFNYIMTGKNSDTALLSFKQNMLLNDIENPDITCTAEFAVLTDRDLDGPNGAVSLWGCHSYSIKKVKGDVVELVDPRNPEEKIEIFRSQAVKFGQEITVCYLD